MTDPDPSRRFEHLVRDHAAALRRFTAAYAPTREAQADLLQEIWIAVWRALPGFRGDCSERTFVFRIAHNRSLTFRARQRPLVSLDALADVADASVDLAAALEASLARDALMQAVRALPDALRGVVTMHLDGCSSAEIAAVLGITENNVYVRLSRARAALRAHLAPLDVRR